MHIVVKVTFVLDYFSPYPTGMMPKNYTNITQVNMELCLLLYNCLAGRTVAGERANAVLAFNETDRSLFLEICGIRQLSQCVKTDPQTENWRPCPSMQAMVHAVIPYIQRFLYHHDELAEVYAELIDNNIGEKIKRLHYGQVRRWRLVGLEQFKTWS